MALQREHAETLLDAAIREDAPQWEKLYQMALEQGLLAVVWDGISRATAESLIPADRRMERMLRLRWAYNVEQLEHRYDRQRAVATELAHRLHAELGVEMLLFKGLPLSSCSPNPRHRPCGDIDCYLMGDFSRANQWAAQQGIAVSYENGKHATFTYKGVLVENHGTFLDLDTSRAGVLEEVLQQSLHTGEVARDASLSLRTLSPTAHALFLLYHTGHHLPYGIGLRHLLDWALFLSRHRAQIDVADLEQTLQRCDLCSLEQALNGAVVALGLQELLPPAMQTPVDSPLAQRVLLHVLRPRRYDVCARNPLRAYAQRLLRLKEERWIFQQVLHEDYYRMLLRGFCRHVKHPFQLK
jgi:hypothetical protein